ncbi:MAG: DMT family transporter [Leptospiraceae bacterium]|nr:DMT family transporter [Leptospiraceae bacterium]
MQTFFQMTHVALTGQLIFVARKYTADFMLLLCALFWGGTFVAIDVLVPGIAPYRLVALRFGLAALGFAPYYIWCRWAEYKTAPPGVGKASEASRHGIFVGLVLGLVSFAGYGLQTEGLVYTSPARSAFITQLLVLFTFPMQIFILRRRVIGSAYAGLLLVLAGAYFLLGSPAGGNWNIGDFLTVGCAYSFALLIVMLDVFSRHYNALDLTFFQILATSVAAAAASYLGMDKDYGSAGWPDWNWLQWLGLLYLAIPATIGTVFLQVRYQRETSPARASLLYAMEPVFAGVFAFLILGEFLGWTESLGAALIVCGVIVSEVFSTKKK